MIRGGGEGAEGTVLKTGDVTRMRGGGGGREGEGVGEGEEEELGGLAQGQTLVRAILDKTQRFLCLKNNRKIIMNDN